MKFSLARQRDKFLKELAAKNDELIENQNKLKEELADKNEDGTPKIENNTYVFSPENLVLAQKEYEILQEETFTIKTDSTLNDLIQNSTVELELGEATLLEEVFNPKKEAPVPAPKPKKANN